MTARSEWTRDELEARLRRPERGENGFLEGKESLTRLEAVQELGRRAASDEIPAPGVCRGINTHIHTNKSFSIFASPSEAVWQARLEGVAVLGINDHYTVAGHQEFGEACRLLGLAPTFSMEAVAQWPQAEALGRTVNDPRNPGRTYLTAKGVTRGLKPGSDAEADLRRMNAALLSRNRRIAGKLADHIRSRLDMPGALSFEEVLALTPHDQPTERHLVACLAGFLARTYPDLKDRLEAVERLTGEDVDRRVAGTEARWQDFLRDRLVKAGRPCFVPEDADAFIAVERMVALALAFGAIPTYPALLNPVTPWEEEPGPLLDRLDALGIEAVEVIPDRNTRDRLQEFVKAAAARGFPIFNGTEHNTLSPRPLVDKFCDDPGFRPHFERGARVLLGHQALVARGEPGLVAPDGSRPLADRRRNLERVLRTPGVNPF